MKRSLAFAMFLAIGTPGLAAADDDLDTGRVIAVQPRPYQMVHEFTITGGVLPVDAFYTGFTLGGSYTLHLSDLFAWEAVAFNYSGNVSSGLDVTLGERWSVSPEEDEEIQYMVASHVIFAPLFGKLTFLNRSIIHASTFLSVGGGVIRYSDGFRPQISVGPGIRLFVSRVASTRLDIRNVFAPDFPGGIDYILHVTLSVSFNFGSVRATELGKAENKDETTGFEVLDELYPKSKPDVPETVGGER